MNEEKEIIIQVLHKGIFKRAWVYLDDPSKPNPRTRSVWSTIKEAKLDLYGAFILEIDGDIYIETNKARIRFLDRTELFAVHDDDPVLSELKTNVEALAPKIQKHLEEAKQRIALKKQS